MIATTISVNFALLVPIGAAIIAAIVGPLWLARHKERIENKNELNEKSGELSIRIIDEGRDMRKELRDRVDKLEERLQEASKGMNDALDEIRRLRYENAKCSDLIDELRQEVEKQRKLINERVNALEGRTQGRRASDKVTENNSQRSDDESF